jgi:beta-glucanase (GH16 family)
MNAIRFSRAVVMSAMVLVRVCPLFWDSPVTRPATQPAGYTLVWSDEFDTPGRPDPAKWTYESGFVRNNEPQLYTDRPANVRVEGGCLVIEARHEHVANPRQNSESRGRNKQAFAEYTSACVTTKGLASWTYGRIEVRASLPNGKGDWPAIWMLGTKKTPAERAPAWPLNGETDIMELWGARDPQIVQSHLIWASHGRTKAEGKSFKVADPGAFHVYAAEWFPDRLDFFVDGVMFKSVKTATPGKIDGDAFQRPQYLLLNLALEPDETKINPAIFPQTMRVDYVRIYQKQ